MPWVGATRSWWRCCAHRCTACSRGRPRSCGTPEQALPGVVRRKERAEPLPAGGCERGDHRPSIEVIFGPQVLALEERHPQLLASPSPIVTSSAHGPSGSRRHQRLFWWSSACRGSPAQGLRTPAAATWRSQPVSTSRTCVTSIRHTPTSVSSCVRHDLPRCNSKAWPPLIHHRNGALRNRATTSATPNGSPLPRSAPLTAYDRTGAHERARGRCLECPAVSR